MFDLKQKTALVTGAGSGIGAEIARLFAKAGAQVYLADIDFNATHLVAQEIGEKATPIALDVTSEEACVQAARNLSNLAVLVNNAGIGTVGNILQTEGKELDRLYAVNVRGMFNMCRAFLPQMLKQKSGSIINMASIGGIIGIRDRAAYCTTKFAVVGLTKSMALDHSAEGVRINCICPGRVETPFVQARLQEYPDPEAARRAMSTTQLTGRMIRPDEIANAALYLASDASYMVTGSTFVIDGGWSAGK